MHLPKNILVGTDFSEISNRALDYAIAFAKLTGGEVAILHAYELPIYGFPDGALLATAEVAGDILTAAQAALQRTCESRAGAVRLTPIVRQGVAWEELNSVAEQIGADLIVIGTHGRTGIAHALIGSIAEKVVRTAKTPVLTLRDESA